MKPGVWVINEEIFIGLKGVAGFESLMRGGGGCIKTRTQPYCAQTVGTEEKLRQVAEGIG